MDTMHSLSSRLATLKRAGYAKKGSDEADGHPAATDIECLYCMEARSEMWRFMFYAAVSGGQCRLVGTRRRRQDEPSLSRCVTPQYEGMRSGRI